MLYSIIKLHIPIERNQSDRNEDGGKGLGIVKVMGKEIK